MKENEVLETLKGLIIFVSHAVVLCAVKWNERNLDVCMYHKILNYERYISKVALGDFPC